MTPLAHDLGDLLPVVLGTVTTLGDDDGDGQVSLLGRAPTLDGRHVEEGFCLSC